MAVPEPADPAAPSTDIYAASDPAAVSLVIALHLPQELQNIQDWTTCKCLRVTAFATTVARRVADNIHIALLEHNRANENGARNLRIGHETEFCAETCEVTPKRLFSIARIAALQLTAPPHLGNPNTALPRVIRERQTVRDYYTALYNNDPETVFALNLFLTTKPITTYALQHTTENPGDHQQKVAASFLCC